MLAAGVTLDDIGIACGGWTISWAGESGPITDGSTIIDGLNRLIGPRRVRYRPEGDFDGNRAPYGVVSVHELPYVEGGGGTSPTSRCPPSSSTSCDASTRRSIT